MTNSHEDTLSEHDLLARSLWSWLTNPNLIDHLISRKILSSGEVKDTIEALERDIASEGRFPMIPEETVRLAFRVCDDTRARQIIARQIAATEPDCPMRDILVGLRDIRRDLSRALIVR